MVSRSDTAVESSGKASMGRPTPIMPFTNPPASKAPKQTRMAMVPISVPETVSDMMRGTHKVGG